MASTQAPHSWESAVDVTAALLQRLLLAAPPSADLVRTIADLDPADLPPAEQLAYLQATERAMAWLTARQQAALVAFAGDRSRRHEYEMPDARVISIEELDVAEVAVATRWSETTAADRVATARLLHDPLPDTHQALDDGSISARHAEVLASACQRLTGYGAWLAGMPDSRLAADEFRAVCAEVEQSVLRIALRGTVSATRRAAERALLRLDGEHARARRERARASRDVWMSSEGDGMALLLARLGVEEAQACMTALTSSAVGAMDAPRANAAGIGAARADALVGAVLGGIPRSSAAPGPAAAPVIRTHVEVTVSLETLLGASDEPAEVRPTGPSGAVGTAVPLAVDALRALIAQDPEATMRRLVCAPVTGHLLDRGREQPGNRQVRSRATMNSRNARGIA